MIEIFVPIPIPSGNRWRAMHWAAQEAWKERFGVAVLATLTGTRSAEWMQPMSASVLARLQKMHSGPRMTLSGACYAMRVAAQNQGRIMRAPARRGLTLVRHSSRPIRDQDNLVWGWKGALDALVSIGLLYDDDKRWSAIEYHSEPLRQPDGHAGGAVHVDFTEYEIPTIRVDDAHKRQGA